MARQAHQAITTLLLRERMPMVHCIAGSGKTSTWMRLMHSIGTGKTGSHLLSFTGRAPFWLEPNDNDSPTSYVRIKYGVKIVSLPFTSHTRVQELKKWFEHHYGLPCSVQGWLWKSKMLEDHCLLGDYGIQADNLLYPIEILPTSSSPLPTTTNTAALDVSTGELAADFSTSLSSDREAYLSSSSSLLGRGSCCDWIYPDVKEPCYRPSVLVCLTCGPGDHGRRSYCSQCWSKTNCHQSRHEAHDLRPPLGLPMKLDSQRVHEAAALF